MGDEKQPGRFSRGQWAVQRERLAIPDYRPRHEFREGDLIDTIMPDLLKRYGLEESHWLSVLEKEWVDLVGAGVGDHTRPGRLDGKTLTVFVDHSTWLGELSRFGKRPMLANIQKRFGPERVQSLRLQLDPDSG
jgi:predicted nucleic acid-binding Zn ribbon protein